MGWLYALHGRSALARHHTWQTVQMLDGLRAQVIGLACANRGLAAQPGRGVDKLPISVLTGLAATLPKSTDQYALAKAYTASVRLLETEIGRHDSNLAERLKGPLRIMTTSASTAAP